MTEVEKDSIKGFLIALTAPIWVPLSIIWILMIGAATPFYAFYLVLKDMKKHFFQKVKKLILRRKL